MMEKHVLNKYVRFFDAQILFIIIRRADICLHTTYRKNNNLEKCAGMGSQWFSFKIYDRHPLQLKKSKSWEHFRSYQLNSTANLANLA